MKTIKRIYGLKRFVSVCRQGKTLAFLSLILGYRICLQRWFNRLRSRFDDRRWQAQIYCNFVADIVRKMLWRRKAGLGQ